MENNKNEIYVKISEVKKTSNGGIFKITLGSCIGILMRNPLTNEFALAHCLLPQAYEEKEGLSAKYVNHGIDSMIEILKLNPSEFSKIEVSIFGGANMLKGFVHHPTGKVGEANILAVNTYLMKKGFFIKYSDLGGYFGRNIVIDTQKNEFVVTYLK